jgi:hypothetical protein
MAKDELNPKEVLTGDDAAEFESVSDGDVSAQVDFPTLSTVATKADKATVDAYADLLVVAVEGKSRGTLAIINKGGTNGLHYRILGSLDNGKTFQGTMVAGPTVVAANSVGLENWAAPSATGGAAGVFTHLKVQVKAAVGAAQTTAAAQGVFASF